MLGSESLQTGARLFVCGRSICTSYSASRSSSAVHKDTAVDAVRPIPENERETCPTRSTTEDKPREGRLGSQTPAKAIAHVRIKQPRFGHDSTQSSLRSPPPARRWPNNETDKGEPGEARNKLAQLRPPALLPVLAALAKQPTSLVSPQLRMLRREHLQHRRPHQRNRTPQSLLRRNSLRKRVIQVF